VVTPTFTAACVTNKLSQNPFWKTFHLTNNCGQRVDIKIDLANHADIGCHSLNGGESEDITVAATASLRDIFYC
jgi:hypothetical protein